MRCLSFEDMIAGEGCGLQEGASGLLRKRWWAEGHPKAATCARVRVFRG